MLHINVLTNLFNRQIAVFEYIAKHEGTEGPIAKAIYDACKVVDSALEDACELYTVGKWMMDMGIRAQDAATLISKINIDKIESPAQLLSYAGLSSKKSPYCKDVRSAMMSIGESLRMPVSENKYSDMLHDKYKDLRKSHPNADKGKLMFKAEIHAEKQFLIDLYNMMKELKESESEVTC